MFELVKIMIRSIFGDGASIAADSLFLNPNTAEFQMVWNNIESIYSNYLAPIGLCILIFMFFYALLDKISTTEVSFEVVGKMICKLVLLCAFMEIALTLAGYMINVADAVVNGVYHSPELVRCPSCTNVVTKAELCAKCNASLATAKSLADTLIDSWFTDSLMADWDTWLIGDLIQLLDCFFPFIACLLPWLISIVCDVLIKVITITRQIEIYARACFLPVALGDSYNGLSSGGVRFFKSFLAVCLQGALIIVILRISTAMNSAYFIAGMGEGANIANLLMSFWIIPSVNRIAATGLILKSMPLAKEICGVG